MKKMVLGFLLVMIAIHSFAQTPNWQWAENAGGATSDMGNGITTDSDGNVYSTGFFGGTANFGATTLISSGSNDMFVAKLDGYGNWIWAEQASSTRNIYSDGICTDTNDNIYITGMYQGTISFGSLTLTGHYTRYSLFVAKMDVDGNWLWAVNAVGGDTMRGQAIDTDSTGNAYITGYFGSTANFGSIILTGSGGNEIFVAKIDTLGSWLWAEKAGGSDSDVARGVCVDSSGNVYSTGIYSGSANFGTFNLTSSGSSDIFVAKMDTDGNWLWVDTAGGNDTDYCRGISVDLAGNVYITGDFLYSANFGLANLTSNGVDDIFVAKIDTDGNWMWAVEAGGSSSDGGNGITTDTTGNVYITGIVRETAYFGSNIVECGSGYTDVFVTKIDTDGNWQWAEIADGSATDNGNDICVDGGSNIFLTGSISQTVSFGSFNLTTNGGNDIFIARYGVDLDTNFDADSVFGYLQFSVNFTDHSLGNIVSWQWDFQNDGIFDSNEQNPTFVYEVEGIYSVKLVISDGTFPDSLIRHNYITAEYVPPAPPSDVQVDIVYPDAVISWTAVDTTIYGTPITPDLYVIQYSEVSEDTGFYYLSSVLHPLTEFTHTRVLQYGNNGYPSEHMFYKVISVKDMTREQIKYLDELNSLEERIKWSEVKQTLQLMKK